MYRIAILANESDAIIDNIRDYTALLVETVNRRPDASTELYRRTSRGWFRAPSEGTADRRNTDQLSWNANWHDAILLQYNPFMYGRWGFSPWLPLDLWRRRSARSRPTIAVMIHEMYIHMTDWRTSIVGIWQRMELLALCLTADIIFVSIEPWARKLRRARPGRPVFHLPVSSTLPDRRGDRAAERHRLGADPDCVVLVAFWSHPAHHRSDYVVQSANAVAAAGG